MFPYIGITDFRNAQQVKFMLEAFNSRKSIRSNRILHVGVMMSRKTLLGLPSKWTNAFPTNSEIAEILSVPEVYNVLHYADYEIDPDLHRNLRQALMYGGDNMDAIQLDMIWPDSTTIAHVVASSHANIEVILQIGKNAIEAEGNDPKSVVNRLARYDGAIDRVLLDKSMGNGLGMDAHALLPYARAIRDRFPNLGIAAAGGLGPNTIHLVEPLVREFPDLSIDAQGKLRPSGSALDPVDWDMAKEYIHKALQLFF